MSNLTPQSIEQILIDLGLDVVEANKSKVEFWYKGKRVTYWIKKQWFSGKTVRDGRGFYNMVNQISPKPIVPVAINNVVQFNWVLGTDLLTCIIEVVDFCKKYETTASLNFEQITKMLSKHSDPQQAADNWYNDFKIQQNGRK